MQVEALLIFLRWFAGKLSHWLAFKLFDATISPFLGWVVRWWEAKTTRVAKRAGVPA